MKKIKNTCILGLAALSAISIAAFHTSAHAQGTGTPASGAPAASTPAAKPSTGGATASAQPGAIATSPKPQAAATSGGRPTHPPASAGGPKREPIKQPVTAAGCKPAPGKPYFVEFRSRTAASYGHTFVFYGQLGGGKTFANFKVAGLHPKGEDPSIYLQGHWMPVDAETGVSYGDLDEQYLTARFCVTLTQAEYTKLSAFIRNLQATTKKWHAGTYNCNSFASDIAKAAGLDSPNPNAYMPDVFIKRMADLNSNRGKPGATASGWTWPNFSAASAPAPAQGSSPKPAAARRAPAAPAPQ